jgi:hypothetical protein
MTKIERRRLAVTLYQGNFEQEIADVAREALAAADNEQQSGPKRAGEGSPAIALAKRHDELVAEAEASAVKVTVWALGYDEWADLADEHPPREDDKDDQRRGLNMRTFPKALLCAALVEPGEHENVAAMVKAGEQILRDLNPSRVHYVKLETAAWNVNVGDEQIPKVSLVSLLTAQNDSESREPSEPE